MPANPCEGQIDLKIGTTGATFQATCEGKPQPRVIRYRDGDFTMRKIMQLCDEHYRLLKLGEPT